MKVYQKTVWSDDEGKELLVKNGPDLFSLVPCTVKIADLKVIKQAIEDVLEKEEHHEQR